MISDWAKKTIIFILCIEAIFFIAPKLLWNSQPGAILVSTLGDLTNIERGNSNLASLTVNPLLSKAAELKAHDMAANGYFAHTSPDGKTPWYWLDQVGYHYDYAGENLAINFTDTEQVTDAWMKSPTHKANIIKSQYTEMGSGIATGTYQGRESVFVVQVYSNPRFEEKEIVATETDSEKIDAFVNSHEDEQVLGAAIGDEKLNEENLKTTIVSQKSKTFDMAVLISLYILAMGLIINIFLRWSTKHHVKVNNVLFISVLVLILVLFNMNFGNKEIYNDSVDYAQLQTY